MGSTEYWKVVRDLLLDSDISELSKSINTLVRSYLLLPKVLKSILSIYLKAFMTQTFLTCANYWCQILMRLFLLTRWVDCSWPLMAIALGFKLLTVITTLSIMRSKKKRQHSCFACTIIVFFFFNVICIGLSWYVMPLLRSWPRDIRFELQSCVKTTLYSLIVFSPDSNIAIVLILFVYII